MKSNTLYPVLWATLAGLPLLLLSGCGGGDGLPRAPISGKVTVNGQPLKAGHIQFIPVAADGPAASAAIVDGAYRIDRKEGPIVGQHRVEVDVDSGIPVDDDAAVAKWLSEPKQLPSLPPEFNRTSTLIAVVENKDNVFDVTMPGKP